MTKIHLTMSSLNVSLNICEYWWEKYKSFSLPLCIYIIENSSMKNRNEYFQCLIESWKLNLLSFKDENVKKRVHEQIQLILSELYSMIVRNLRQRRISAGFSKEYSTDESSHSIFFQGKKLNSIEFISISGTPLSDLSKRWSEKRGKSVLLKTRKSQRLGSKSFHTVANEGGLRRGRDEGLPVGNRGGWITMGYDRV